MNKIIVLGSNGMLGNYVYKYFKLKKYDVVKFTRMDFDITDIEKLKKSLYNISLNYETTVINCVGTIKPRIDELGILNGIKINSVFPHELEKITTELGLNLIHPTTDCVFTGNDGKYDEHSQHDVSDVYGRTKSLGEPENATVIRTSIIGEEIGQSRSLVEWVKSNKNKEVNGYTNHIWNGVTCLQFAKICEEIINRNLYWKGVRHLYSNSVNKYELTQTISDVYNLNITVNPYKTDIPCDRSLSSIYKTDIQIPTLKEQIIEMKCFYDILKSE